VYNDKSNGISSEVSFNDRHPFGGFGFGSMDIFFASGIPGHLRHAPWLVWNGSRRKWEWDSECVVSKKRLCLSIKISF
jgi:hypothetical protein